MSQCSKCGFSSAEEEFSSFGNFSFCSVCSKFVPDSEKEIQKYAESKIDWQILETFRNFQRSISQKTKLGMEKNISEGKVISRAPFGYQILNKQLVVDIEKAEQLKSIFQYFAENPISLTQLGKKYNLTTSGIKKILMNPVYIGKIKFGDQEIESSHNQLINKQLFEQVQQKLSTL
jgi:DNA invertase Pin-like site-specific DNA recombinase